MNNDNSRPLPGDNHEDTIREIDSGKKEIDNINSQIDDIQDSDLSEDIEEITEVSGSLNTDQISNDEVDSMVKEIELINRNIDSIDDSALENNIEEVI